MYRFMTSNISQNVSSEEYKSRLINKLESLEELSAYIKNDELLEKLCCIHDAMETIWDPNERLIKNFTDHGIEHSNRVAHNILCLLKAKDICLSDREAYTLLASIYLHDIGMQCDIKNFTKVFKKAEEYYYSATHNEDKAFKINYTARDFSDFDYYEQKEIRNNHHLLTAAWIDILRKEENHHSILHKAAKSIPDDCFRDIIDICMYHSKLDLNSGTFQDKKKLLLAALLRFGDELDIAKNRISPDMYQTFRVAAENSKHWWLHEHTKINYDELKKGRVVLTYYLNHADFGNNSEIIKDYFYFKFEVKNAEIAKILEIEIEPVRIESGNYEEMHPDLIKGLTEYEYDIKKFRVNRAVYEMQRSPKKVDNSGKEKYVPFYSLVFDIPENWKSSEEKSNGGIEIKLEHNSSYIKINVINIDGHGIPQILTRKLLKDDWKKRYNDAFSWSINTNIGEHYIYYILFNSNFWKGRFSVGTGLEPIRPDCVEYPYYAIKYNCGIPNEWIVAWTKPEYENKIVAIRAKFNEEYGFRDIKTGGSSGPTGKMQLPLYCILENFKMMVY